MPVHVSSDYTYKLDFSTAYPYGGIYSLTSEDVGRLIDSYPTTYINGRLISIKSDEGFNVHCYPATASQVNVDLGSTDDVTVTPFTNTRGGFE